MTKSRSKKFYNQAELYALQAKASERLEELLDYFGIVLERRSKFYVGTCPIHGGDNDSAFNIFHQGDAMVGNWRCFSRNCHKHFHATLIGLVRGLLSAQKYGWTSVNEEDKECSFQEAVEFLVKFTGTKDLSKLDIDYGKVEKLRFASKITNIYSRQHPKRILQVEREQVKNILNIPSEYFLSRGFSREILIKYDVGDCPSQERKKEMFRRAVAPVYDEEHKMMIGCTGRSIYNDPCPMCNYYHSPLEKCPQEGYKWQYTKWRNSKGFPGEDYFYNYWFAKDHIRKTGVAVIVESPGNVWKLEEVGVHNSIATFGAHLTDGQRNILDNSGALALIVLTDPDAAGTVALREIEKSCSKAYAIYSPRFSPHDIADTSTKILDTKLIPFIRKIEDELAL